LQKKKMKKKMGCEDERGRVPESSSEWIYLRVPPSWEPISAALAKGPEMDPQKMR
jgi:hypothetical protein